MIVRAPGTKSPQWEFSGLVQGACFTSQIPTTPPEELSNILIDTHPSAKFSLPLNSRPTTSTSCSVTARIECGIANDHRGFRGPMGEIFHHLNQEEC